MVNAGINPWSVHLGANKNPGVLHTGDLINSGSLYVIAFRKTELFL